jgi:hypothetical protein
MSARIIQVRPSRSLIATKRTRKNSPTEIALAPGEAPSELFAYLWESHFSRAVSRRAIDRAAGHCLR